MATIDSRGFVDDGSQNLTVRGSTTLQYLTASTGLLATGPITSSVGSFGQLGTVDNHLTGQTLLVANTYVPIQQWLTASITSTGVVPIPTGSMSILREGMYVTTVDMSFSGTVGIYTFSMFRNGVRHENMEIETSIQSSPGNQMWPTNIGIHDLNFYYINDTLDVRVKCDRAPANFQMTYGTFILFRFVG